MIDDCGNRHDGEGRFAGRVLGESDPSEVLGGEPDPDEVERFNRTRAHIARVVRALDRKTGLTGADSAIDLEDAVQEIHLRLLQAKANGVVIERETALINVLARSVFREVGPMRITSEDRAAIIQLGAWRAAYVTREGHAPSTRETNTEAERIRDEWRDPRHRPTKDFHLWAHGAMSAPASIFSGDAEGDQTMIRPDMEARTSFEEHPFSVDTEGVSWMEVAESCIGRGEFSEGNRRDARTFLFAGLAQAQGVPVPTAGHLSKASLAQCRDALEAGGGIDEVIGDFQMGRDTAAVEAMFRPWSGRPISHSDRVGIVGVLQSRRGAEADMWESALRFASRAQLSRINEVVDAWVAEGRRAQAA